MRQIDALSDTGRPDGVPASLAGHGTVIKVRRGQSLPLSLEGDETVFVVRTATLMLGTEISPQQRQGLMLLHPGDVFRSAFAPSASGANLFAVGAGEVQRFRFASFSNLVSRNSTVRSYFNEALARQTARQAIHLAAIAQFDSLQRLSTFFLELALRTGVPGPDGSVVFPMPLSRKEQAEYLGLNADTLSRTLSRLRATGFVSQPDRHTLRMGDLSELSALTPAAPALAAIYGEGPNKIRSAMRRS